MSNQSIDTNNTSATSTTDKNTKKQDLICAILLSVCFAFNLFVFAPVEVYIANIDDIWFGQDAFLWIVLLFFVAAFAISFILTRFIKGKARLVIVALIFSLTVALYVQGNFLAGGYPIMDGETIPWDTMVGKGIVSTLIWLVIFAIPLLVL
ncbi:hypothetical protein LJB83_03260, partial [Clostridia bacterium OttesenSCG-928-F22]|nr:hypothetical protein [Clostridia bacterium OttesenSCG-928-F22]